MRRAIDVSVVLALSFVVGWCLGCLEFVDAAFGLFLMAPWLAYQNSAVRSLFDAIVDDILDDGQADRQTQEAFE